MTRRSRLVAASLVCVALATASSAGAQVWPMAEQGIYLTTFAIATVWAYRRARAYS